MPTPAAYDKGTVLEMLRARGRQRQALFDRADALRRQVLGDAVHLRGIVEFSNRCANDCHYCGIRASNRKVERYSLCDDEILTIARRMSGWGQSTIVLQSGETPSPSWDRALGRLVERIKRETDLAVTLSVGNRPLETYAHWRDCGMDRYLLRFETSDRELFARLHPDCALNERLRCLDSLRRVGAQAGGGFMIGLPGETLDILADNILLCRDLDLDMVGVGPFLAHPDTPLAGQANAYAHDPDIFFLALATLRLVHPRAHIPATTAFDAAFPGQGRSLALTRGANVFMPSNTPTAQRNKYLLYPDKPGVDETGEQSAARILEKLRALGRPVGQGPGHCLGRTRERPEAPAQHPRAGSCDTCP